VLQTVEKSLNYEGSPTFTPIFGGLWDTKGWDYVADFHQSSAIFAWHTGRPSDRKCPALLCD